MKRTYIWDKDQNRLVEYIKKIPEAKIFIIPDIQPYLDENMGHHPIEVRSRRHKSQLLKEKRLAIK